MTISCFFVISGSGDRLLLRSLRRDNAESAAEEFYSAVTDRGKEARPVFKVGDVVYYHVRRAGLYFVATTAFAVPPAFVLELINRIIGVFKDFCGILSEESLRHNFVLAYELLDELLDFGYVQCTNTSQLKQKVCNTAVIPSTYARPLAALRLRAAANPRTVPSVVSQRPITGDPVRANEIFFDVLEKLSAVLGPNDTYKSVTIEGQIQVKSFLRGTPTVRLALNEGIVINNRRGKVPNVPVLDFCNFHHCVDTGEFEKARVLSFSPSEGEFTLMSYRISGSAVLPFKVKVGLETTSDSVGGGREWLQCKQASMTVNIFSSIPQHLEARVRVNCPLPKCTTAATLSAIPPEYGQSAEYRGKEQLICWDIRRFRIVVLLVPRALEYVCERRQLHFDRHGGVPHGLGPPGAEVGAVVAPLRLAAEHVDGGGPVPLSRVVGGPVVVLGVEARVDFRRLRRQARLPTAFAGGALHVVLLGEGDLPACERQ
ncbi:AP-4 complex subunit mu-1 [Babesia caballi]|uniref:AP-4 complex subunit mu-1 n=1 Tax=Babesia caballi TaxID=5871 RepID=A0AAV4LV00_BABCB|nr:AP-4 complex subunit mu-1 [Babesia caballi]